MLCTDAEENLTQKFLPPSTLPENSTKVQKFKKQKLLYILKQKLEEMYEEEFSAKVLFEINKLDWIHNLREHNYNKDRQCKWEFCIRVAAVASNLVRDDHVQC